MHNVRGNQEENFQRINLKSGIKIWQNPRRIFNAKICQVRLKLKVKRLRNFLYFYPKTQISSVKKITVQKLFKIIKQLLTK